MARSKNASGYLPSLDGWRCLAIAGVMLAHDDRYTIAGHSTAFYQGAGGFGVQLFFAISGILISWRIQADEKKTGHFALRDFYVRRFFRIQPAQWVYLSVVAVLMAFHLVAGQWRYWFGALFLYENYLWHEVNRLHIVLNSYLFGHFWTLAVEEHFYLLISLFFFVVKRRRFQILGAFLVLLLGMQALLLPHLFSMDVSGRRTPWVIQSLIFPAWVAIGLKNKRVSEWIKRWFQPWKAFLLSLFVMAIHHLLYLRAVPMRPATMIYNDSIVLFYSFTGWVVATMLHPDSLTTRLLEMRPLKFLGRLSYSLYLWHLLFFGGGGPSLCPMHWLNFLNTHLLTRYGCSVLLACVSYFLIEKPMIRLGHRLAPPATPGHRDLGISLSPPSATPPLPARMPV